MNAADIPPPVAAIVDPYSSGALLAPEFRARGWECIAVQTDERIPPVFRSSYRPADFKEIVLDRGHSASTRARLSTAGARLVLPGCETGVALADSLSEALGLPSNGTRLSRARRDKLAMNETVRAAGLRAKAQHCTNRWATVRDWVEAHGRWPVVVKPVASAGSDGVARAHSWSELECAFKAVLGQRNMLGLTNESVLVEEYLEGTEYIVDTVSHAGRHRLAAYWRYTRPESRANFIGYDAMEFMDGDGPRQRELWDFTLGVLDALGVRYGPAHCEVMWSNDSPVLMEIGTRLSAGNNPILGRECAGLSALDLTVESYVDPARFLSGLGQVYRLTKVAMNVFLVPPRVGRLQSFQRLGRLRALPSLHELALASTPIEPIPHVVGVVTLMHTERGVVERDVAAIRELEKNGLYELT